MRYYDIARENHQKNLAEAALPLKKQLDLSSPTQWLKGESTRFASKYSTRPNAPIEITGQRQYIPPAVVREMMKNYFCSVGDLAFEYLSDNMPGGYQLHQYKDKYGLLEVPHLGWCQFAGIRGKKLNGEDYVIRIHYANFTANLNSDPQQRFFDVKSMRTGQMFFGVAFCKRPDGNGVMIDRGMYGGILFSTNDSVKVLDNVVKLRTGRWLREWAAMTAKKKENQLATRKKAA